MPAPIAASPRMKASESQASRRRARSGSPAPRRERSDAEGEPGHEQKRGAARQAVPELDQGLEARGLRNDLAVAERPVRAAAGAGAGGADDGAPEDDHDVDRDRDPGQPGSGGESGIGAHRPRSPAKYNRSRRARTRRPHVRNESAARAESLGQSVWLDFIRRSWLEDGTIARLIREDGVWPG